MSSSVAAFVICKSVRDGDVCKPLLRWVRFIEQQIFYRNAMTLGQRKR